MYASAALIIAAAVTEGGTGVDIDPPLLPVLSCSSPPITSGNSSEIPLHASINPTTKNWWNFRAYDTEPTLSLSIKEEKKRKSSIYKKQDEREVKLGS